MSDSTLRASKPDTVASCEGKERFETHSMASRVSARRQRNGRRGQPYHCQRCNGFHLGELIGGRKQRARHRLRRMEVE